MLGSLVFSGISLGNGLILIDEPIDDLTGSIIEPEPPRRPWPIPRPRPIHRHMPLDLKSQRVEIEIKDQLATTNVRQVFKNSTSRRLEGTFIFPIPKDARVEEFAMEVNGEIVEAELLDAKKARQIYEDIVRRALDPALFEYAGRGLFKVRIFPIEPHSEKEVRIKYTELLKKDGNIVRYDYPLNVAKYCRKPIPDFSLKIDIEAGEGKALKTVYSPSHEIEVSRKGKRRAVLGLETDKMSVDEDLLVYYSLKSGNNDPVSLDFLTSHGDGGKEPGHFMLLVSPDVSDDAKVMPKDLVIVFDSSGSMRGEKMKQAQEALDFVIESLNPDDRFEVIRFSTEAEAVFEELVDATDENRKKALKFVEGVRAIGGTAIEEALTMAVSTAAESAQEGRPTQVLFLTDGKPTLGATQEKVILNSMKRAMGKIEKDVRVFCFGIGTKVNTHLLDLVTEETRAVSQYVLPDEDIEEKVSNFYAKISDPVLSNLKLKLEGANWVRNRYPKDLPDIFRGDQLLVLGRYQTDQAQGLVKLTGWVNGKEREFEFPVKMAGGKDHEFIANLWATRRVGYLLDQIRLHGESNELRDEVVELARKYAIVTPYTTYLIVEDEARRDVPTTLRTLPPRPAARLRGGDSSAVRESAPDDPFADVGRDYDTLTKESDGAGAVAGATSTSELKYAKTRSSGVKNANEAIEKAEGRALATIPSRNIRGKTFYQNAAQIWIDAEAQAVSEKAKRRQIKFASDEYFTFLAANVHLADWLSVGSQVQVVVEGELIEIIN